MPNKQVVQINHAAAMQRLVKLTSGHKTGKKSIDPRVRQVMTGKEKGPRYALITQILGKQMHPEVDILATKVKSGEGGWSARSLSVTVANFERQHARGALGSSVEPYVSNPLRAEHLPGVGSGADEQWEALASLLADAEDPKTGRRLLKHAVSFLMHLADEKQVTVKQVRKSAADLQVQDLDRALGAFLKTRSNGERLQTVVGAIYATVSGKARVQTGKVNACDKADGSAGDVTITDHQQSRLVSVVEVKDRPLNAKDVHSTLRKAADAGIHEVRLIVRTGRGKGLCVVQNQTEISRMVEQHNSRGWDICLLDFETFKQSFLQLSSPASRRQVAVQIAEMSACDDLVDWQRLVS